MSSPITQIPTSPRVSVILTGDEKKVLLAIIDIAIKTIGLSQGSAGLASACFLAKKVEDASEYDDSPKRDWGPENSGGKV